MTEEPIEAPTPLPIPRPEAPSKKRPIMRRKGRDRGRELLVVLGILVVALAMLTIWSYTTLSANNAYLQSQLTTLNATHQAYVGTHSYNNTEVDELMQIINLEKSEILQENLNFTQEGGTTLTFIYSKQYAGYIVVNVNSTSFTTYVRVRAIYEDFDFSYEDTQIVGESGTAVFPVLPSEGIEVIIGNVSGRDTSVALNITYHY